MERVVGGLVVHGMILNRLSYERRRCRVCSLQIGLDLAASEMRSGQHTFLSMTNLCRCDANGHMSHLSGMDFAIHVRWIGADLLA